MKKRLLALFTAVIMALSCVTFAEELPQEEEVFAAEEALPVSEPAEEAEPAAEEQPEEIPEEPAPEIIEEDVSEEPVEEIIEEEIPEEPVEEIVEEEIPEEPVEEIVGEEIPEEPVDDISEEEVPEEPADDISEEEISEEPVEEITAEEPAAVHFSSGYIRLNAGTKIFAEVGGGAVIGVLAEAGNVYAAIALENEDPAADWIELMFADGGNVCYGYVKFARAYVLNDAEAAQAVSTARGLASTLWINDIAVIALNFVVEETAEPEDIPEPEETAETAEIPAEDEVEETEPEELYILIGNNISTAANDEIVITSQPQDFAGVIGETAVFSVEATGDGLTYQWYYHTKGATTWTKSGQTGNNTPTLSVSITSTNKKREFCCIIKNAAGNKLQSQAACIVEPPAVEIVTQPTDFAGTSGTAVFTVEATGSDLTYQWYYRTKGATKWTKSGQTGNDTPTLNVSIVSTNKKREFYCVIKDAYDNRAETALVCIVEPTVTFEIVTPPENFYGNIGDTAVFTVEAQGEGLTYQWKYRTSPSGVWTNNTSGGAQTDTFSIQIKSTRLKYEYCCVITDINGETLTTDPVCMIKKTALAITADPQNAEIEVDGEATFTVTAAGDGLTYLWQTKKLDDPDWVDTGCTAASFIVNIQNGEDGMDVRCVVTDRYGETATSGVATLTVFPPELPTLEIITPPENFYGSIGDVAVFTVEAQGEGLTYQWKYRTSSSGAWNNSTTGGAKTDTLSVTISSTRLKYEYCCVITDISGETLTTDPVHMVKRAAFAIITPPEDFYGSIGDTAVFTVEAQGEGLTYQWKYRTSSSGVWTNNTSGGAQTDTFSIQIKSTRLKYEYCCVITDISGETLTTDPVRMVKKTALEITADPQNAEIEVDGEATFTVTAAGDGLTYLWQTKKLDDPDWVDTDCTAASFIVNIQNGEDGMDVRCIVTDQYGETATSGVATLTVFPPELLPPEIITQPENFYGSTGAMAVFTVEAQGEGLTYQWKYRTKGSTKAWSNNSTGGAQTATFSIQITATRLKYEYCCEITGSNGESVETVPVWMVKKTALAITADPQNAEIEVDGEATFTVTAAGDGLTYLWQTKKLDDPDWVDTDCTAASFVVNIQNGEDGMDVRCIVTDTYGETVTSGVATLTVFPPELPAPEIITQPADYYGIMGETAVFTVEAQGEGLTYQWKYRTKGTANAWSNNTSGGAQTDTFSIQIKSTRLKYEYCCEITGSNGESVETEPVCMLIKTPLAITTQPVDALLTAGEDAVFTIVADGMEITYNWQVLSESEWVDTGCTAAEMTVAVTAETLLNTYRCVVTDRFGDELASNEVEICLLSLALEGVCDSDGQIILTADPGASGFDHILFYERIDTESTLVGDKTVVEDLVLTGATLGEHTYYATIVKNDTVLFTSEDIVVKCDKTKLNDVAYALEEANTVTLTGYTGNASSLTIPGTVDGFTVTAIGASAFEGNTALTEIDLPDSITTIGQKAFKNCSNLSSMH